MSEKGKKKEDASLCLKYWLLVFYFLIFHDDFLFFFFFFSFPTYPQITVENKSNCDTLASTKVIHSFMYSPTHLICITLLNT